jgi:hypothetical protein
MDTVTTTAGRAIPWNKDKLLGQKPPLKLKEIWAIRIRLQLDHRARELALFNLAIDSKPRGCDLVRLRVHDVVHGSRVAARAIVTQRKTQRPVQFETTEQTRDAVAAWVTTAELKPDQFLFPSRVSESPHLSTRQYPGLSDSGWGRLGLIRRRTAPIHCGVPNRGVVLPSCTRTHDSAVALGACGRGDPVMDRCRPLTASGYSPQPAPTCLYRDFFTLGKRRIS